MNSKPERTPEQEWLMEVGQVAEREMEPYGATYTICANCGFRGELWMEMERVDGKWLCDACRKQAELTPEREVTVGICIRCGHQGDWTDMEMVNGEWVCDDCVEADNGNLRA